MFNSIIATIIVFAAIFVFLMGVWYLLKILIIDPINIKKLFEQLKLRGYSDVDPNDPTLASIIRDLRKTQSNSYKDFSETVLRAVKQTRGKSIRYLCDLNIANLTGDNRSNMSYMVIAEKGPLNIGGDIYVRRKVSKFFERLMPHSGVDITANLDPKFNEIFSLYSETGMGIVMPQRLQQTLINCSSYFPFNRTRGIIAGVCFSSWGWGILCQRAANRKLIDQLIQTVDQISNSLEM